MAASLARKALRPTFKCLTNIARCQQTVSQVRFITFSRICEARWFTKEHEWVTIDGQKGVVGISEYAQDQLGDIVYVEMPEVGATLEVGDVVGCLESVKAASDLISPVGGSVTEVNTILKEQPDLVNSSPLEKGWIYKIDLAADTKMDELMDEKAYVQFLSKNDE